MAAAVLGVVMIEMPRPLANSCEVKTQSCGEPKVELMHCGLNVHGDAGSSGSSSSNRCGRPQPLTRRGVLTQRSLFEMLLIQAADARPDSRKLTATRPHHMVTSSCSPKARYLGCGRSRAHLIGVPSPLV